MRILLRADAGRDQGTGHVMRMLTLGNELQLRNHEVALMTSPSGIDWLEQRIKGSGIRITPVKVDALDLDTISNAGFDTVVIDGYRFRADDTKRLAECVPSTLAVVDGDDLGYSATLYLDQNPGAERGNVWKRHPDCTLAGLSYCLLRSEVLRQRERVAQRQARGLRHDSTLGILVVMGGSDPKLAARAIGKLLEQSDCDYFATIVDPAGRTLGRTTNHSERFRFIAPSSNLEEMLSQVDVAVSAAGTTALELLSCGIPTALLTVASNQTMAYSFLTESGAAYGLGTVEEVVHDESHALIKLRKFLNDPTLRASLRSKSLPLIDGHGSHRVADALEKAHASISKPE